MFRNGIVGLDIAQAAMNQTIDQLQQTAPESNEALKVAAHGSQRSRDWPQALKLAREMWERDPGSEEANRFLGSLLFITNQFEEATMLSRKAVELDPLSLEALTQLIGLESSQGRCDEVRNLRERVLEIEPGYARANGQLGFCLLRNNADPSEALLWLEKEPLQWMKRTGKSIALHRLERQEQAMQEFEYMLENYGDTAAYQYAEIFAQWGEKTQALEWLQKALEVGDPGTNFIAVDPFLDPIRQDPWFDELLQQAGLADCCNPET
jgi:tetratricopeptide (TPR) repeat protein